MVIAGSMERSRQNFEKPRHRRSQFKMFQHALVFLGMINVISYLIVVRVVEKTELDISASEENLESVVHPMVSTGMRNESMLSGVFGFSQPDVILNDLPAWVQKYLRWHNEMRLQFPGRLLFTHPNAPKLLIRACFTACGGLHDRLGKLPWDLYIANQTGRLLLINWCNPVQLENFLEPNAVDWSVPKHVEGFRREIGRACHLSFQHKTDIFEGFESDRPSKRFFEKEIDIALTRATNGTFTNKKILYTQMLGSDIYLKPRLLALNETDSIDWTPTFGKLFWLFFKPTPSLKAKLDAAYNQLGLVPKKYSAVHCRVTHPKAVPKGTILTPKEKDSTADRTGILWEGKTREFAVSVAIKALRCAGSFLRYPSERVYFYSDSEDLVKYVVSVGQNTSFLATQRLLVKSNQTDDEARAIVYKTNVVSRDVSTETLHIDKQPGHAAEAYYDSFVDLFIASGARCIAVGVGNYAVFAAKISGTKCAWSYEREKWGAEAFAKYEELNSCPDMD